VKEATTASAEKQLAKLKSDFKPLAIQKTAKLEASYYEILQQCVKPKDIPTDHLDETNVIATNKMITDLHDTLTEKVTEYQAEIDKFKVTYDEAEKLMPEDITFDKAKQRYKEFTEAYMQFFLKAGHQKELRAALKEMKTVVATLATAAKKVAHAAATGNSKKRKALRFFYLCNMFRYLWIPPTPSRFVSPPHRCVVRKFQKSQLICSNHSFLNDLPLLAIYFQNIYSKFIIDNELLMITYHSNPLTNACTSTAVPATGWNIWCHPAAGQPKGLFHVVGMNIWCHPAAGQPNGHCHATG
jgi:hypothetical protein